MKNCKNPLRFAKCVFCTLLVSCAIFFLKSALQFQEDEISGDDSHTKQEVSRNFKSVQVSGDDSHTTQEVSRNFKNVQLKDVTYAPENLSDEYTNQMVRRDFHNCIIQPSKTFCVEPENSKSSRNISYEEKDVKSKPLHPVHSALVAFSRLCKEFDIQPVLIEPSVVFCILTEYSQKLLLRRRFNITSWTGGENVLNFAINESDSLKLSDLVSDKEFLKTDFSYWSTELGKTDADQLNVTSDGHRSFKAHHFFVHQRTVIHVVVFYHRENYLWHGSIDALPNEILNITPMDNLLFSKHEAIYERFLPIEVSAEPVSDALYIPSDPRLFLHQMESSRFLHCNSSNGIYANQAKENHGYISEQKFNEMTLVALQQMKIQLHPELMTFWIMGGTLLGWYRQCGIIQYTTDVDFAAWAIDIDDSEKLMKKFLKNKHLELRETMGLPKEALEYRLKSHGLQIDLFFCYDDGEHYWVSGHRPSQGYYFPYNYPKFTLCSAALLGHKVQVPCEALEVILSDYGPDWIKPISKWNYESSPKNMGKKHYWYEEEKPLAYKTY